MKKNLNISIFFIPSIVVLTVFGICVQFDFIRLPGHDDATNLLQNPFLLEARGIARFWRTSYQQLYIPVTYTLWHAVTQFQQWLWPQMEGLSASLFHGVNVLLHAVNASLVLLLLLQARMPRVPAVLGALFFALHPLHVETVAWASAFKDLVMGCFALCSLLAYVQAFQSEKRTNLLLLLSISAVTFALSLLSKPTAIVLPLAAFVWTTGVVGIGARRQIPAFFVGLVLSGMVAAWTLTSQPAVWIANVNFLSDRIYIAMDTLVFSVRQWFFPLGLTLDYGRTPDWVVHQKISYWLPPAILVISIPVLATLLPRAFAAALVFAAVFILPVSGIQPFMQQIYSTFADRYQYLPIVGVAFCVAFLVDKGLKVSRPLAVSLGAFACLAFGAVTISHLPHWQNAEALASHALFARPLSWFGHKAMADVNEERKEYMPAIRHMLLTLYDVSDQNKWMMYGQISRLMKLVGQPEVAAEADKEASRYWLETLLRQAEILVSKSDYARAALRYRKVLEVDPKETRAIAGLEKIPPGTPELSFEDVDGQIQ